MFTIKPEPKFSGSGFLFHPQRWVFGHHWPKTLGRWGEKIKCKFLTIILFRSPMAVGWPVTHRVTKCLLSCLLIKIINDEWSVMRANQLTSWHNCWSHAIKLSIGKHAAQSKVHCYMYVVNKVNFSTPLPLAMLHCIKSLKPLDVHHHVTMHLRYLEITQKVRVALNGALSKQVSTGVYM